MPTNSSTSKIAKCSITTNRKSTTSHRELISESSSSSSSSSSKKASLLNHTSSKKTSSSRSSMQNSLLLAGRAGDRSPSPEGSSSQRGLLSRLNNSLKGDLFDRSANGSMELKQQQESSSVHHSRQSFSSTSTSMLGGSLRKEAVSRSLASEAALVSRHSKSGALSSDVSAALSSSSSSRHFKSSLLVSDDSQATHLTTGDPTSGFLNSESLFSSPNVRSLVKEIGTEFAELENALISTNSSFGNRSASSLSSRLFGVRTTRRPLSPLGDHQYPAITAAGETNQSLLDTHTGNSNIHSKAHDQSSTLHLSSSPSDRDISGTYKLKYGLGKLSSVNETPRGQSESGAGETSGDRIRELMCQAQKHVDKFGTSTVASSNESSTTRTGSTPFNPNISDLGQVWRKDLVKEKAEKDEDVKLHQSHCKAVMTESIERIDQRMSDLCKKFGESHDTKEAIDLLKLMIQMIEKAWSVPVCGDDLGFKLCNSLREAGGLDIILGFIQESEISRKNFANQRHLNSLYNTANETLSDLQDQQVTERDKQTNSIGGGSKNKTNSNKLRLNLSKINSQTSSTIVQSPQDASATNSPAAGENTNAPSTDIGNNSTKTSAQDSDSELLTSDLGFDSTSVDSLSYVTPPSAANSKSETVANGGKEEEEKKETGEVVDEKSVETDETEKESHLDNDGTTEPVEVPTETMNAAIEEAEREETNLIKDELVFLSAQLLSQCLTSENRNYIVENGLDQVIRLACNFTTMKSSQNKRLLSQTIVASKTKHTSTGTEINSSVRLVEQPQPPANAANQKHLDMNSNQKKSNANNNISNKPEDTHKPTAEHQHHSDKYAVIGTEILQHLFKHSEDTCQRMISLGGLEAILYGCRSSSIETLRHCASALANLALYGGPEGQQQMIEQKAHVWLFPLAFNEDDNIQYYACLAIVVLVANQEIEADVLKSSTLDLVEPFVTSHEPKKFAESTTSHIHGQSANWLCKLIPLLESKREEARNLACFHFAMEAYIKKEQNQTQVFKEIGAVEPLRKVGSSPIAIASKFACQALRLIGEKEPHKLSQQVPLWTSEDVSEWVSQIGFERFKSAFVDSRVDGDLLLQLDEEMLRTDIGIDNGIVRRRFLRELSYLKRIADYSSVDKSGLSSLLSSTGHDFVQYIYPMIQLGVTRDNIHLLDSEQLLRECHVTNTIHRMKLAHGIKELQERLAVAAASNECSSGDGTDQKTLDVFMSYRRSTGSQLASLLKVFLELRNFSVFIDVERLEAGKFDNNLLDSIKAAKNFILILSPNALDRCIGDHECKDWVHKEIVAALASNCNIIPIIDNFHWPDAEQLPEDMRSITYFNGVRWIHDYQDACVDKVERFIRGELSNGTSLSAQSAQSAQSSLQRIPCGSIYSSTPSLIATPSLVAGGGGFLSDSVGAYSSRGVPFDTDYHPLSFANHQYLQQQQQQYSTTTPSGGRRQI